MGGYSNQRFHLLLEATTPALTAYVTGHLAGIVRDI